MVPPLSASAFAAAAAGCASLIPKKDFQHEQAAAAPHTLYYLPRFCPFHSLPSTSIQPVRRSSKMLPPPAPLLLLGWSTRATSSLRSSTLVVIPAKLEIPREKSQSSLQPASAHMHAQGYAQPSNVLTPAGNSFLWKWGLRYLAEISATSVASLPSSLFLRRPRNLLSPRDLVPEPPLIYGRRSFVPSILC